MPNRIVSIFATLLLSTILGCSSGGGSSESSDSGTDAGTDGGSSASGSLSVTTYNLGLLPQFVALTNERVQPLAQTLSSFSSDVLCLQEVWRPSDRNTIVAGISSSFPNIFEAPARQKFTSQTPACTVGDLAPTLECLLTSCAFTDREFTECALAECKSTLDNLAREDRECAGAIFAQAGRSSSEISQIQDELFSSSSPAGLFAFNGSSGLILASKYELSDRRIIDFFDQSTTSRRVALLATVTVSGVKHQVACTHLTSNLDGLVPYTGPFTSWQDEGLAQASRLLAEVQSSAPTLLAGDFNCSLRNSETGVESDFAPNCEKIITSGYQDFAGEQLGCSFCSNNSLNQMNQEVAGTRDLLLDHIFTANLLSPPSLVSLALTEKQTVAGQSSNLSDHFAVKIVIPVP